MECMLVSHGRCSCVSCKAAAAGHLDGLVARGYKRVLVPSEGKRPAKVMVLPPVMASAYVAAGAGTIL